MNGKGLLSVVLVASLCSVIAYKVIEQMPIKHVHDQDKAATALETSTVQKPPLQHLACVIDGNRRYAKARGLSTLAGHNKGYETQKMVIRFCLEKGIKYLSLYIFSIENFRRAQEEQDYLFTMALNEAEHGLAEFKKHGVRVRIIGDKSLFPESLKGAFERAERETAHLDKLQVNLLFCYGGQQEIAASVQSIARQVQQGLLKPEEITPQTIAKNLWLADIPEPDLIIRTGGFKRMSNFLLYQSAYSEFVFLDCMGPELTVAHLEKAVNEFVQCKRNFGA